MPGHPRNSRTRSGHGHMAVPGFRFRPPLQAAAERNPHMATNGTTRTTPHPFGPTTDAGTSVPVGRFRRQVTEADLALAARVRVGDRDAFADLYRSTVDRVTAFVAARIGLRNRDLVDDLVQEA